MNATKGDYAEVNGLRMYYEVHGEGRPLVVLHGAYMTVDAMGSILPGLAESRRVIVPEMQGLGRTADIERPITYEGMADDVAALIRHLGLDRPDAFGYSMGGGVALQLAIRHPGSVRRLVVASASYTSEGMQPELHEMIPTITPEMFSGSPMEASYQDLAPNPEDFPTLVEKLKRLDMTPFDWPSEDVRGIGAPTMIVVGDSDAVRLEHAVEMFRLLAGRGHGGSLRVARLPAPRAPRHRPLCPTGERGPGSRRVASADDRAVPGRTRGGGGAVGGGRAVRRVPDVAEPARGGGRQVPGTSPLRQLGTPARITTGRRPFCQSDSPCGSRR